MMSNGHVASEAAAASEPTQDEYFTSYDDLEVHKLMLEDVPRTTAYQQAIEMSGEVLRDKVVLGKFLRNRIQMYPVLIRSRHSGSVGHAQF